MSIREVRPGVWDVEVYGHDRLPNGKYPRRTKRIRGTRRDAKKVEAGFIHDAAWRRLTFGRNPNFDKYALAWLEDKADIEAQTRVNYRAAIMRYLVPSLGTVKLRDVTPADVRRVNRTMAAAGLSGSTRHYAFRVLSMIMRQADIDGFVPGNPCIQVKPPKDSRKEPAALTPDEVRELLLRLEVANAKVHLLALVAYDTGLRRGELLALRWSDIDLKDRVALVTRAVEQIGPDVRLKEPKSARSRRSVKLSEPVAAALKEHRAVINSLRMTYRGRLISDGESSWPMWVDQDLVFPSVQYQDRDHPMGRIWTPHAFSKAWRNDLRVVSEARAVDHLEAGGKAEDFDPWDFGIHRLRHTHATHLLRAGIRDEVVSRALGHSSSTVTRSFYSHVIDGEQSETAVVTGAVISGGR